MFASSYSPWPAAAIDDFNSESMGKIKMILFDNKYLIFIQGYGLSTDILATHADSCTFEFNGK